MKKTNRRFNRPSSQDEFYCASEDESYELTIRQLKTLERASRKGEFNRELARILMERNENYGLTTEEMSGRSRPSSSDATARGPERASYKGESNRELTRRRLKLTSRNSSKENYYSSDEEFDALKNSRNSRHEKTKSKDDWNDISPEQYYSKQRSDCNRRSSGRMKPEKYDGSTCFETFLVQFNNCAQFNQWDEMEKLHYLRWSLDLQHRCFGVQKTCRFAN